MVKVAPYGPILGVLWTFQLGGPLQCQLSRLEWYLSCPQDACPTLAPRPSAGRPHTSCHSYSPPLVHGKHETSLLPSSSKLLDLPPKCWWAFASTFPRRESTSVCSVPALSSRSHPLKPLPTGLGVGGAAFQGEKVGAHSTAACVSWGCLTKPRSSPRGSRAVEPVPRMLCLDICIWWLNPHRGILHLFYLDAEPKFQFCLLLSRFLFWEDSHKFWYSMHDESTQSGYCLQ